MAPHDCCLSLMIVRVDSGGLPRALHHHIIEFRVALMVGIRHAIFLQAVE